MFLNNLQAIYIMWLREMKRFFRAKSRVFGSIALPFFFLLFMGFGLQSGFSIAGLSSEYNYIDFLVPGIIGMTMIFSSTFTGFSVLWDKEFGFLKEIMVAPVSRTAIVLGRIAGGLTTTLIQGLMILFISLFLGFTINSLLSVLLAIVFMLLIGIVFIGFGIAVASVMEDTQGFSLIVQFFIFPVFLLSGAFFPVSNLPSWLRPFAYIDPLTYGVDGLRSSLINFSEFNIILDLIILVIFGVLMVTVGSYLFNKTEI